jgi:hypothetical protein
MKEPSGYSEVDSDRDTRTKDEDDDKVTFASISLALGFSYSTDLTKLFKTLLPSAIPVTFDKE